MPKVNEQHQILALVNSLGEKRRIFGTASKKRARRKDAVSSLLNQLSTYCEDNIDTLLVRRRKR